jgi:hypothetical protein
MIRTGSHGVGSGAGSAPTGPRRWPVRCGATGAALAAAVVLGMGGASAALAAPVITIPVGCSVNSLNNAISGAPSDAILVLAKSCTYSTPAPLKSVTDDLTIEGDHDTIH